MGKRGGGEGPAKNPQGVGGSQDQSPLSHDGKLPKKALMKEKDGTAVISRNTTKGRGKERNCEPDHTGLLERQVFGGKGEEDVRGVKEVVKEQKRKGLPGGKKTAVNTDSAQLNETTADQKAGGPINKIPL